MLDVNVRGVFLAIQASVAQMHAGGRVVTNRQEYGGQDGLPGKQRLRDDQGRRRDDGQGHRPRPRAATDYR
jgi:NAD(P)-dependent dehydrogenase (short-subunit alcohol dehydrogenase family)